MLTLVAQKNSPCLIAWRILYYSSTERDIDLFNFTLKKEVIITKTTANIENRIQLYKGENPFAIPKNNTCPIGAPINTNIWKRPFVDANCVSGTIVIIKALRRGFIFPAKYPVIKIIIANSQNDVCLISTIASSNKESEQ